MVKNVSFLLKLLKRILFLRHLIKKNYLKNVNSLKPCSQRDDLLALYSMVYYFWCGQLFVSRSEETFLETVENIQVFGIMTRSLFILKFILFY